MAKIPTKLIIDTAKKAKPVATEYIKKNPTKALAIATGAGKVIAEGGKVIVKGAQGLKNSKVKVNYRKIQYKKYHSEILPNLNSFSYIQLISHKHEVKDFINQISREETVKPAINKPILSKQSKAWGEILIQIEDKINSRNYEEFLKSYNSEEYKSNYFDEKMISHLRNIESKEELYQFIQRYTGKSLEEIEMDFL